MIYADYEGYIVKETDKAIGLSPDHGGEIEMWLPKSKIGFITYTDGDSKEIVINEPIEAVEIPEWLAEEKGLI